jgi:predicted RNase H-like HicB family nuclease
MTTIHNVSVTSRVLLYQERDGTYVAHALETDLIGEGNSPNKAMADLRNALEAQITFAIQMGNTGMIQREAPADIITRWEKANKQSIKDLTQEGHTLHVKAVAKVIEITPKEVALLRSKAKRNAFSASSRAVACA